MPPSSPEGPSAPRSGDAAPTPDDPASLLGLATSIAARAAGVLVAGLDRARAEVVTKSSRTDLVTDIDRASEQLIVEALRRARPDDAVLAEEGGGHAGTSGYRWVIDPVDGTTNYVYGHPPYAVSIALEDAEGALVGVVHDAASDEVFTAVRGGGATLDGRPIRCSSTVELPEALVATGFSYDAGRRGRQAQVLRAVLPAVRDIRRHGAASVDLCWVACGRVDAFYERGLAPWDLAAGGLVARESGARTVDLDGGPASPAFVLAAPPALVAPLTALLRPAGAADA